MPAVQQVGHRRHREVLGGGAHGVEEGLPGGREGLVAGPGRQVGGRDAQPEGGRGDRPCRGADDEVSRAGIPARAPARTWRARRRDTPDRRCLQLRGRALFVPWRIGLPPQAPPMRMLPPGGRPTRSRAARLAPPVRRPAPTRCHHAVPSCAPGGARAGSSGPHRGHRGHRWSRHARDVRPSPPARPRRPLDGTARDRPAAGRPQGGRSRRGQRAWARQASQSAVTTARPGSVAAACACRRASGRSRRPCAGSR